MKKKSPDLDFSPQANMLKLIKSAKQMTNLTNLSGSRGNSPKRSGEYVHSASPMIMDLMSEKGNFIYTDNRSYAQKDIYADSSDIQSYLANRHKDHLNNYIFQGQHPLTLNESNPNTVEVAMSADAAQSTAKPRSLWKKSVDSLRQGQPPDMLVSDPRLSMKSQRYLPEDAQSDVSDCSSRASDNKPHLKTKDSLKKRPMTSKYPRDCSEVELSYLKNKQGGTARDKIYTIDSDRELGLHSETLHYRDARDDLDFPEIFSDHNDNYRKCDQPIIHLNSSPLHHTDVDLLPENIYNKHFSTKDKNTNPQEINDRNKQTHCRSCLSKVPNYPAGPYGPMRSPYNRCEACVHMCNLYDISEDQMLQEAMAGSGSQHDDLFGRYWPQTDGPHVQKRNKLRLSRQHSVDNIMLEKPKDVELNRPARSVSLKEKERPLEDVFKSDRLFGSRSTLFNHNLEESKRSKSLYPDHATDNPFMQALRDDARLVHGRSSSDIYKQLAPVGLRNENNLRSSVKSAASFSSREGRIPNDVYISEHAMPYVANKTSAYSAPRVLASSQFSNRRVYKKIPSLESDV